MKVRTSEGIQELPDSYAARLIEQGYAVPVKAAPTDKPKQTKTGSRTKRRTTGKSVKDDA